MKRVRPKIKYILPVGRSGGNVRHQWLSPPSAGVAVTPPPQGTGLYQLFVLVLAISYGAVLSQLPSEEFKDFSNYLFYAEHSWSRLLGFFDRGALQTFANEPVWLLVNSALSTVFPPETVVRLIIFVSATLIAWSILKNGPRHFIWLVAFLLLPFVVKNHLVHLRQGVAISLFLWAWFSPSRTIRWVLMGVTPFVHASFFFVLPILWAARGMTRVHLGWDVRALGFVVMGVSVGFGLVWLAGVFGAGQAETYDFAMTDVSGLGFVLWLGILTVLVLEGRRFLYVYSFEIGLVVFYLSTYWLLEVTARIFESGILLVLLAGLGLTSWRRPAFLAVIAFYGLLAWILRTGEPGMGFVGA